MGSRYEVIPGATPITANSPVRLYTPEEFAIMALGPSLWIDARPDMAVADASGIAQIQCRATGRWYQPGIAGRPKFVAAGTGYAIDFTPGAAATRALFSEDGVDTLLGGNVYTIAGLVNASGGALLGAADAGGQYPLLFADQSDGSRVSWWSNLATGGKYLSGQTGTGGWKIVIVSSSANSFRIEVDGVGLTYASSGGVISQRKGVIGGAGADGSVFPLVGRLVSEIEIGGVTAHEKASVYNPIVGHLNALRAKLNA